MEVKAVSPRELIEELERSVEQRRRDRYSLQVKLEDVEFAFDEEAASALELDPEMNAIEEAEHYLRKEVLSPVQFAESDGTRHQVRPRPRSLIVGGQHVAHQVVCLFNVLHLPSRSGDDLAGQAPSL